MLDIQVSACRTPSPSLYHHQHLHTYYTLKSITPCKIFCHCPVIIRGLRPRLAARRSLVHLVKVAFGKSLPLEFCLVKATMAKRFLAFAFGGRELIVSTITEPAGPPTVQFCPWLLSSVYIQPFLGRRDRRPPNCVFDRIPRGP